MAHFNQFLAFLRQEETQGGGPSFQVVCLEPPYDGLQVAAGVVGAGDWNFNDDLEAGNTALNNQIVVANNVCIGRISRPMEDNRYTPHVVAIGPYHRSCSPLWMEKEKQRCVAFMQALSVNQETGGLNGIVQGLERKARESYGLWVAHMTAAELAKILLRDGCYLLHWLRDNDDGFYTFGNTEHRDVLYLIENQLPFSVLDEINGRTRVIRTPLTGYFAGYVRPLLAARKYISAGKERLSPEVAPRHLLDLVHTFFHPSTKPAPPPLRRNLCTLCKEIGAAVHNHFHRNPQPPDTGRWRLATDYRINANLKFMRRDFAADVTCVLDVHLDLERGTLWIPLLQVDSGTWTLLRNLMALEEQTTRKHVTAYCMFMSQLACTLEDVRLLVDANIVQHFLASDEIAAQGFADLCNGVVLDVNNEGYNYLKPMWHQLEGLCGSRRRNFKGSFRQKYLSKALHKLAFGITVFLALCQLLQTLYAPIGYHFPKKGS